MMQSRLDKLSACSEPQEIAFLVQNVHSLRNIIRSKTKDKRLQKLMDILLEEPFKRYLERLGKNKPEILSVTTAYSEPLYKIAPNLSKKAIQISTNINGELEKVEIEYTDFFETLKKSFGNDPLISFREQTLHKT